VHYCLFLAHITVIHLQPISTRMHTVNFVTLWYPPFHHIPVGSHPPDLVLSLAWGHFAYLVYRFRQVLVERVCVCEREREILLGNHSTLHCTRYRLRCTRYTALYSLNTALYSLDTALHSLYTALFSLCNCAVLAIHRTVLATLYCIRYTPHYTH
jgi:hypothetical protein